MRGRKKAAPAAGAGASAASLPPDMLANIHGRLSLLERLAFGTAFHSSRHAFMPEAPWLVLPGNTPETVKLFSLADRCFAVVRTLGHDQKVLGSSPRGWLVTADDRARLRLVHPVTGERRALPAIDTISCLCADDGGSSFSFHAKHLIRGIPPNPYISVWMTLDAMRRHFYRKVVLSDSADMAMLITNPSYGAAAFATAECRLWRLGTSPHSVARAKVSWPKPSCNGVEDAVHHAGRFYLITYSGRLEAWEQDADAAGVFTSAVVGPGLLQLPNGDHRKYLVAAPGGRLMVVLKETTHRWNFKVHVLDDGGEQWKETDDIGDAALFIGVNSSFCVSTREHPELRSGCIYDGQLGVTIRVFSLKNGTVEEVNGPGLYRSWPPPEWFIPSS